MARASPTASSSRASGERPGSAFSLSVLRAGCTTRARPLVAPWLWLAEFVKLDFVVLFRRLEELNRLRRHHGRDRMLVDELRMRVAPQQDAEIVEPGDDPLQFHAIDEKYGDGRLVLSNMVEKHVLNVL